MRLYLDSWVLIYALDGAEQLRRQTLQQLERYGDAGWVISDLVRMESLVGPLHSADQIRLLAHSFGEDCVARCQLRRRAHCIISEVTCVSLLHQWMGPGVDQASQRRSQEAANRCSRQRSAKPTPCLGSGPSSL